MAACRLEANLNFDQHKKAAAQALDLLHPVYISV